jgi:YidC/Oxa1 family membrane protein insertase
MDRNTLSRWALMAAIVLLGFWAYPRFFGSSGDKKQPIALESYANAPDFAPDPLLEKAAPTGSPAPAAPTTCTIKGNRFSAELSSRGAALAHFRLLDANYTDERGQPLDMVSSNWDAGDWANLERWRPMRTLFRGDGADDQVKFDRFDWKTEPLGASGCKFTYVDEQVSIEKTIKASARPFELSVETTVKNLAAAPKKHRFTVETFAFRKNSEVKSHFGRTSPFVTDVSCGHGGEVTRKNAGDFKDGWLKLDGADRWASASNYYFAGVLVPQLGGTPSCRLLAEEWFSEGQKKDDDDAATVFHAQLAYEPKSLDPGTSATYTQIAFFGPKERGVLKAAGGAEKQLGDLINLGFFSPVAKVLVGFLVWLQQHVTGNWGLAIIVMTFGVRLALFPLTWKSIKTTVAMRRLKPEMDDIARKFADDMQAKNLATMELYKKRGVNPFGGCLPQLVQMPIWFAMYTTLQTAVEMYHTHFLWFHDLSAPDQLLGPFGPLPLVGAIPAFGPLPLILGAFMILQQRIVPQQGMDPMQQKMMAYLLPGIFTVMMLFLPAALGLYMLTNSVLGITQQLLVERFAPHDGGNKKGQIEVKEVSGGAKKAATITKGKARV